MQNKLLEMFQRDSGRARRNRLEWCWNLLLLCSKRKRDDKKSESVLRVAFPLLLSSSLLNGLPNDDEEWKRALTQPRLQERIIQQLSDRRSLLLSKPEALLHRRDRAHIHRTRQLWIERRRRSIGRSVADRRSGGGGVLDLIVGVGDGSKFGRMVFDFAEGETTVDHLVEDASERPDVGRSTELAREVREEGGRRSACEEGRVGETGRRREEKKREEWNEKDSQPSVDRLLNVSHSPETCS